ncbi:MAG: hypothetical protein JOZ22_25020 [Acidobacteriia bacterium]|nr:hypothetical protein [Terriglobia bacterium]
MRSGPPKIAERVIALLIPPACREEVTGDLHERYRSAGQYFVEAALTIPLVIASRIRRTADAQVLTMHAFALYLSFLCAARFSDPALLEERFGLLRLAIPVAVTLLGILLEDAYAKAGKRSALQLTRGPFLGLALALGSQGIFRMGNSDLVLTQRIFLYGSGMGFLLTSAIRLLFPPAANQLHGANIPAMWLKREAEPVRALDLPLVLKLAAIAAAVAVVVALMSVTARPGS